MRCGQDKPAAEFPQRRYSTSDGLGSHCLACKAAGGAVAQPDLAAGSGLEGGAQAAGADGSLFEVCSWSTSGSALKS